MVEYNFIEAPNICPNLNGQQFILNKFKEVKDFCMTEIKKRGLKSKRLSKYVASFVYINKSLILLSATSGSISITLIPNVIGAPVGIISARFSLAYSISTGVKKLKA